MKILVAGATGVIGRHLVPRLVANGHEVVGMTRSPEKRGLVEEMGARPAVADALDAGQVGRVVAEAQPEVIAHQLTSLSMLDVRRFERSLAQTNRLRTEATDHLLAAGRAVDVQRFVAQSFAGWPFAPVGGPVKSEDDPLDPEPVPAMRPALDAIRYLEGAVTGASWTEGIVLRYGFLYGPGTSLGPEGDNTRQILKRQFPIIGDGSGVWSFVHVEDAAAATVVAIERGRRGIYNIVDDDPAPVAVWLPEVSRLLGGKPPRRVPRWLGRLLAGPAAMRLITASRGASNQKAKRELGWQPGYRSWRDGFGSYAA